ncbi:hypothetical protein HGB47_20060 [Leptospira yasudae]|uniref:hypothetical protein n=1 Tax=Leptospira yasudae TaxID=2202201 RepID=UPI001C4F5FD8|nr:hypothetical protein [Leptospira yasudae]MBW0435905.1 hypothetical protein [Leptospira yasudae]
MYLKEDENKFSSKGWELGQFIDLFGRMRNQIKFGMSTEEIDRLFENFPSMRRYTYRRPHIKSLVCNGGKKDFLYDRVVIYQDNSGTKIDRDRNLSREILRESFTLSMYYKNNRLVHFSSTHEYLEPNSISGPQSNHCYLNGKRDKTLDYGSDSILIYHVENIESYKGLSSNVKVWSFVDNFLGDAEDRTYKEASLGSCKISFNYVEDIPEIICMNQKYNRYLSDLAAFELEQEGLWRLLPMETDDHLYLEKISESEVRITYR